jgi:hypothetical protein
MKTVAALSALVALSLAAPCGATTIKPGQGVETQVGSYSLISYFTKSGADLQVVTTAQRMHDEDCIQPIRVISNLRPGQEATLSVPEGAGEPAISITIVRIGDSIELHPGHVGE